MLSQWLKRPSDLFSAHKHNQRHRRKFDLGRGLVLPRQDQHRLHRNRRLLPGHDPRTAEADRGCVAPKRQRRVQIRKSVVARSGADADSEAAAESAARGAATTRAEADGEAVHPTAPAATAAIAAVGGQRQHKLVIESRNERFKKVFANFFPNLKLPPFLWKRFF